MHLRSSDIKPSMGLKSPFKPLARIWAKYLPSFESKATDYLELRLKFFMMSKMKSSNKECD